MKEVGDKMSNKKMKEIIEHLKHDNSTLFAEGAFQYFMDNQITEEELSKYPAEVQEQFLDIINNIPFVKRIISPDIPYAKDLKGADLVVFFFFFLIGGPIFGMNQILTTLLDCILPEGWDDDDFNQKH